MIIKDKKRNLSDCLVITAGLIAAGIITESYIFFYIAGALSLITALIHPLAWYISFIWQWIGKILGFVISKIILSILFYFFLFPFSLLHKLFAKNKSITNQTKNSYWIDKDNQTCDFTKLW